LGKTELNETEVRSSPEGTRLTIHHKLHLEAMTMKLIYRGSTYEYDPTQPRGREKERRFEDVREPFLLMYRGNIYRLDPNQSAQATYQPRSAYQLIYRGNTYWVQPEGEQVAPTATGSDTLRNLASVHRANLQRNLQRRIQVARERGDQALLALLEAEQRQLV
jgi:hypothetical protein